MNHARPSFFAQIACGVPFLILSLASIAGFLALFSPEPYEAPPLANREYQRAALQAALAPEAVREELDTIAAFGDRFPGKPGLEACAEHIRARFEAAGLEMFEQGVRTPAPVTQRAELTDAAGAVLPISVYPLMPNFAQPSVTPPAGVRGELVLIDDDVLRTRQNFAGCLALVDVAKPLPKGVGLYFEAYARLGFSALLIAHSKDFEAYKWGELDNATKITPVNYPRAVADSAIFDAVGETVTLHLQVRYENLLNHTVIGRLKAATPAREAVVVACSYDALSSLPDASPGLHQALQVAIQLRLLEGLRGYREGLKRDVIFVAFGARAMGRAPQNELLRAIGIVQDRAAQRVWLTGEQAANARLQALSEASQGCFEKDGFFVDEAATKATLGTLDEEARAHFEKQFQYVLNTEALHESERLLQAKIAFEKSSDTRDLDSPEFKAYQAAKKRYDRIFSCAGYGIEKLLADQAELVAERAIADKVAVRFREVVDYHQEKARYWAQGLALNEMFGGYRNVVVLASELAPTAKPAEQSVVSFTMGADVDMRGADQASKDMIQAAIRDLALDDEVRLSYGNARNHGNTVAAKISGLWAESRFWSAGSYPGFTLVNLDRSYADHYAPFEAPHQRNVASLARSLAVFGECVLSAAHGNGVFRGTKLRRPPSYTGAVYVANVGQSMIPNYPLAGALVQGHKRAGQYPRSGRFSYLQCLTDVYGRYDLAHCIGRFTSSRWDYSPEAFGFDEQGVINLAKDEGPTAQRVYKSMHLSAHSLTGDVNIVCFRSSAVSAADLINPQSMKPYTAVEFIRQRGLSPFENTNVFRDGGIITTFLKPDEYFYVKLKAGSAGNELVQTTRGFLLGTELDELQEAAAAESANISMGREIRGSGYLAQNTPFVPDLPYEAAKSMAFVNQQRLTVQNRFQMADKRTREFQEKGVTLVDQATAEGLSQKAATQRARDALSYATLNHPILRNNIFEAVWGILWYLGLLVPFAFFFEKLIFGFPDIRKQLGANTIIFLAVFALLKFLHPAFTMIRSSLMILLGFVILLIATGIIGMFSSKFKENLESIKKARGQVSAAEVNKLGAIAVAFMLGLNNMHRRRVRTLLTCGTLVLITFVMICFTSVQSNLVEKAQGTGKAPYNGFISKPDDYRPVDESQVVAYGEKYGERYEVASRKMVVGLEDQQTRERRHPGIELTRQADERPLKASPHGILILGHNEPLAPQIRMHGRWFTEAQARDSSVDMPLIIADALAEELRITPEMLAADPLPRVSWGGEEFPVQGIFDSDAFERVLDLDGRNLLPFDITAMRELNQVGGQIIADDEAPRLSAAELMLIPRALPVHTPDSSVRTVSISVALPEGMGYKDAKAVIDQHMEQMGEETYYGVDGYAFVGKRARESSLTGLLDMLIPLVIAAMTVLNTIRGSVYERKEEIFVYNAVGIAATHVFFMFFAEAIVYAVVGSVLGYLLSQGTGALLTALNFTGGLNMTFTSLGTIYASWAITAAVFVSTWFPARTAMQIAAPSTDLGWGVPEPEGDCISFNLPFTFDWRDRVAVLEFCRRHFLDHGEGSSGAFFAGTPELGVSTERDPLCNNGPIPQITVPIWLKPFDLGVSQQLTVSLPTDPETGEFIAQLTLTRQSGSLDNWRRLNKGFIGLVRRQFLHWRAVGEPERAAMFVDAKRLLESSSSSSSSPDPLI